MTPVKRAERIFDEAKRQGMVNPITGDGAPSIGMVTDAIHDAESDGYQSGSGDEHQNTVKAGNRLGLVSVLAEHVSKEEIEKTKLDIDNCSMEVLVILTALRCLAEYAQDTANDLIADGRTLTAEGATERSGLYRQCYVDMLHTWGGRDSSNTPAQTRHD